MSDNKHEVVIVGLRKRAKRPGSRDDVVFKKKQIKIVHVWSGQVVDEYC